MSTRTDIKPAANGKAEIQSAPKASPIYGLASKYNIDPNKLIEVIRGTVMKPDKKTGRVATNEELAAFCIVAQQYDLNPFTKEIYGFLGKGGGIVPIVGVDGWVKMINRHAEFDGCDLQEVEAENGKPHSVVCTMYVKGRSHPIIVAERFSECVRDTDQWRGMPWRMLRHKAYMQAGRYAFGLAGIYDEDEGRDITIGSGSRPLVEMPRAIGEIAHEPQQESPQIAHDEDPGPAPDDATKDSQSPENQAGPGGAPEPTPDREAVIAEYRRRIAAVTNAKESRQIAIDLQNEKALDEAARRELGFEADEKYQEISNSATPAGGKAAKSK